MKKFIYAATALAGIAALASCSQDEPAPKIQKPQGQLTDVTLTVQTPEGMRARSGSKYGEGTEVQRLVYAIYDADGTIVAASSKPGSKAPVATDATNTEWTLEAQLVQGDSYSVFFWADGFATDSPYTIDDAAHTVTVNYEESLKAANAVADSSDAFSLYTTFTPGASETPIDFTLTRPFAQVNLGSKEISFQPGQAYHSAGVRLGFATDADGVLLPTELNYATGKVGKWTKVAVTQCASDYDATDKVFPANSNCQYIYMGYILAPANIAGWDLYDAAVAGNKFYAQVSAKDGSGFRAPNVATIPAIDAAGSWFLANTRISIFDGNNGGDPDDPTPGPKPIIGDYYNFSIVVSPGFNDEQSMTFD